MNELFSIKTHCLPNQQQILPEDIVADIRIDLMGQNLTKNYDKIDNEQKSSVLLAPYPMALWFVSNWWRLRWEPTPSTQPTTDWRMSHLLSAAGYGCSWPTIGFQTDGETIRITSIPTTGTDGASVVYETPFSAFISAEKFEKAIEKFINYCNNFFGNSDILDLWNAIQEEKNDIELSIFRQIEARLGFDAGDGPEEAILAIMDKSKKIGTNSIQELSSLLHNDTIINEEINALENHKSGIPIAISNISELRTYARQKRNTFLPWDLGYDLAQEARRIWGISDTLSTKELCDVVETHPEKLYETPYRNKNFGLGSRLDSEQRFSVILNKKHPTSIRFMLSRIICDAIISSEDDIILPATNNKTARQKTQRAFAAELLCPIEKIKERINKDYYNEDLWSEIAEEFDVNPLVVKSQLANHHLINQFENTNLWFDSSQEATTTYLTQDFI